MQVRTGFVIVNDGIVNRQFGISFLETLVIFKQNFVGKRLVSLHICFRKPRRFAFVVCGAVVINVADLDDKLTLWFQGFIVLHFLEIIVNPAVFPLLFGVVICNSPIKKLAELIPQGRLIQVDIFLRLAPVDMLVPIILFLLVS